MKRSMIASVAISALSLMTFASCGKKDDAAAKQQQMPAPTIAVTTVGYGDLDLNTSYPATIKGKNDTEIRPQVSGFITSVNVDEGAVVKKGQVLFTIDQVQFQAAVDQAEAQVQAAQTALNSAQLTANQKKNLYEKDIISEYEYQLAQNDLARAQSALSTAKAALTTAQKNMSYTVVTSPSDGVVGSIPFRVGSLASPSTPLTTVTDNSEVYAYFSLTEKDLLQMTDKGATSVNAVIAAMPPVQLRLADGSIYPEQGKVATVSGVIGAATGAATVRALFKNPTGMLRSGSTGEVLIPAKYEQAIVVPQRATQEVQGRRFVYVVDENNTVNMVPITVATVNDGQNFIVTGGLEPGMVIAVEGIGSKLRPGMEIQPIDAAAKAAMAAQQGQQQGAPAAQ